MSLFLHESDTAQCVVTKGVCRDLSVWTVCVCVFVCIVLLIVIYLNFNKELNNLINDDFETSGKITKYVIICIYKLFIIYNYNL